MKAIQFSILMLVISSGYTFAAEPGKTNSSAQPYQRPTNTPAKQGAPLIGSMLPDGREVPARFQGVETKEQKARRENREQNPSSSEKD